MIESINQSILFKLDSVRSGCPITRARGSCIKHSSIPDRIGIQKCLKHLSIVVKNRNKKRFEQRKQPSSGSQRPVGFSGRAQTRYKKYPCKAPCKRNSYETICENIVSRYQTLVSSLSRGTTFRHQRPKAHFMTGPHRQPCNNSIQSVTMPMPQFHP